LLDLWKSLTSYIDSILSNKRKASGDDTGISMPLFIPSRTWERVPGYQPKKTTSSANGASMGEMLNFSAVAATCGFSREVLETGLKDIVHSVARVLRRGTKVALPFGKLGKLYFQNSEIRLIFTTEFIRSLSDDVSIPNSTSDKPPGEEQEAENPRQTQTAADAESLKPGESDEAPQQSATEVAGDVAATHLIDLPPLPGCTAAAAPSEDSFERAPSKPEDAPAYTTEPLNGQKLAKIEDAKEAKDVLDPPFFFNIRSLSTHTHPHSGDRLWTDLKCPICRQRNMPIVELRDSRERKGKEQDRLLLHLSLELDRDFLKKTKEMESSKLRTSITTAQYNHTKALEKDMQRKRENLNMPLGNIFENRDPGPDRHKQGIQLSAGLQEQMVSKQIKKAHEKLQKEYEDKVFNQRFLT
ncbi:hypothetical protein BDK51DRAFT_28534, partial [Blyttiomyces helicus]